MKLAGSFRRPLPQILNLFFQPPQQLRNRDPQRLGDHQERQDRGILQPPLNIPDKSPVQAGPGGKILLRPALLFPKLPDARAKRLLDNLVFLPPLSLLHSPRLCEYAMGVYSQVGGTQMGAN